MSIFKNLRPIFVSLIWVWALTSDRFIQGAQPTLQDQENSEQKVVQTEPTDSQTKKPEPREPSTAGAQEPISSDSKDWKQFEPVDSNASFKMPVKPALRQRMFTPVEGQPPIKIHNYLGVFNNDKGLFLFNYHDLNQAPVEALVEEALKLAMLESISSVRGRLVSEQKIRYRTNPGRTFEFRFSRDAVFYKGIARIFLVGKRQYQVAVMMEESSFDQKISDSFLNSLRLIEPESNESAEPKDESETTAAESAEKTDLPESESNADSTKPELKLPLDDGSDH